MSEFWKRKMRKYFFTLDFDKKGVISKDDFVGMSIRFSKSIKAEKQKAEQLKTHFEKVWEQYLKKAEVGDRDSVTEKELMESILKQRYDPDLMKPFSEMIRDLHDMLDVNRDGYLQEDEYQQIFFNCGILDQSCVKETFRAIDVNGDGKLSVEEYTNAFFDFLFSDDEKSPSACFFGPLGD